MTDLYQDIIDIIVDSDDLDKFREYRSRQENSFLQVASREGRYTIAKYLLSCGADPNRGNSLCEVAESGSLEMAKLLLENKANVLVDRNDPNEPFNNACREGRLDMIKLLIKHGARPSEGSFSWACQTGSLDCVEFLYEIGAYIGDPDILYFYSDNIGIVRFLVIRSVNDPLLRNLRKYIRLR